MNGDEINSLVTKIVLTVFSIWGGAAGATGSQGQAVAAGAGALAAIAWGVYSHWNMKKAPEGAVVIPPK